MGGMGLIIGSLQHEKFKRTRINTIGGKIIFVIAKILKLDVSNDETSSLFGFIF